MDLSVLMHMIKFLSYKIIDVNIMGGLRVSNTSSANDVISFIRGMESLQQEIVWCWLSQREEKRNYWNYMYIYKSI